MTELKYNVLTFRERCELGNAYHKWFNEENEIHKGEYELADHALQVITFLSGKGLLDAEKVGAFLKEVTKNE